MKALPSIRPGPPRLLRISRAALADKGIAGQLGALIGESTTGSHSAGAAANASTQKAPFSVLGNPQASTLSAIQLSESTSVYGSKPVGAAFDTRNLTVILGC